MAIKVDKVEKELNIQEILILEAELNGTEYKRGDERVVIKGIINQPIWQSVKIHLSRLNDLISDIKKKFFLHRDELIKKYGKEVENKDGSTSFDLSENMDDYRKEEADLLSQGFKISVPVFDEEDLFPFKSEESYSACYKFLLKTIDE